MTAHADLASIAEPASPAARRGGVGRGVRLALAGLLLALLALGDFYVWAGYYHGPSTAISRRTPPDPTGLRS